MTVAQNQRAALCDALLDAGPDAPTLCEGWNAHDLAVHCVLRESGDPRIIGAFIPGLSGLSDAAADSLRRRWSFEGLVEHLRQGPPALSPFSLPGVDAAANVAEYFVHTEDVRRPAGLPPRPRDPALEADVAKMLGRMGRALLRKAPVGVTLERSDTGQRLMGKPGANRVVVVGAPSELLLFAFGRTRDAKVELIGSDADVAALVDEHTAF